MSFTDKLAKLSLDIRHRATGREFEEENYLVRWDGPGKDHDYLPGRTVKELTVERYKSGPVSYNEYGPGDENFNYYVCPGSTVWNLKFATFDWVDDVITCHGKSHPTSMEELIGSLQDLPNLLCAESEWIVARKEGAENEGSKKNGAESPLKLLYFRDPTETDRDILLENGISELDRWSGDTASAYTNTFGASGNKWTDIVQRNYYLAELLVTSAEAQLAVFITARESIMSIADKTSQAMWSVHESDGDGWRAVLNIVGVVVTAGLSLASFGTASTLVGAGIAITKEIINLSESGETGESRDGACTISGDTVSAVLASMSGNITDLDSKMLDEQHEIRDFLWTVYNSVVTNRSEFQIVIDKDVAPMSQKSMGERTVEGQLSKLCDAAENAFPAAAKPMLKVNAALAAVGDNHEAFAAETHGGVTSVHAAWLAVRDVLQDLTGANGDIVKRAGEVLLKYAVDIGELDDSAAADIDKTYRRLDAEYSDTDHEVHVPPADTGYTEY